MLLQLIIKGSFSLNIIALNSLLIKIASFTICNRANNLAFILNIITISCLFALYIISPLNSFIMYPYKLFLLTELSINNALLAQINDCTLLLPSLLLLKIASFTVYNRANNLVSMFNIITISCLFALYIISPLNSFIMYLYKLFLLTELSVNNILLI